jgi:hypothetical protein
VKALRYYNNTLINLKLIVAMEQKSTLWSSNLMSKEANLGKQHDIYRERLGGQQQYE